MRRATANAYTEKPITKSTTPRTIPLMSHMASSTRFSPDRAYRQRLVSGIQFQSNVQLAFLAVTFQVCRLLECAGGRCEEAVSSSLHGAHVEISVVVCCNHLYRR